MRAMALFAAAAFGVAAVSAASVNAAPIAPNLDAKATSNIVQVWGGCGWGFHPTYWGGCVPNRAYYRPYWRYRRYGYYHPYWRHHYWRHRGW